MGFRGEGRRPGVILAQGGIPERRALRNGTLGIRVQKQICALKERVMEYESGPLALAMYARLFNPGVRVHRSVGGPKRHKVHRRRGEPTSATSGAYRLGGARTGPGQGI